MGNITQNSLNYINSNYPELNLVVGNEDCIVWQGRFYVNIEYKNLIVNSAPRLGIKYFKSYPNKLPIVYDLDDRFLNTIHRFVDLNIENEKINSFKGKKTLCLATEIDMDLQLSNSKSIEDYIIKFLLPYFISYESSIKSGKYVFGDRSHGSTGLYQSLADFFQVNVDSKKLLKKLLVWSTKTKRFRSLFIPPNHRLIELQFSMKIGELRNTLGLLKLKRHLLILYTLEQREKESRRNVYEKIMMFT